MQFVIVGVDPGVTTGVAVGIWDSASGDGVGLVELHEWGVDELVAEYERVSLGVREGGLESSGEGVLGSRGGVGDVWWDRMHAAGVQLSYRVDDLLVKYGVAGAVRSDGAGGAWERRVWGCVVMEDYILSPNRNAGGMGGRDAVVPVALGAVCWGTLKGVAGADGQGAGVRWFISPPSAKKVVSDQALDGALARGMGGKWRGKGHSKDAARHVCLAVRQLRKVQ